ncbi:MAG: hypothetical protein OSJ70_07260 [Bacilli bacterium]|nr:hypothetical protein [Bacilli bacterium]
MLREVIDNLKIKRQKLIEVTPNMNAKCDEDNVKITIDKYLDFLRMQISDYVSICEYTKKTDLCDNYEMCKKISMSILWNSGKQKINKGTFYVYTVNNVIYNFWTDGKEIMIDERIKTEKETQEKILRFDLSTLDYAFTFFKHNSIGSTFYTMYYHTKEREIGELAFSKEEAYEAIRPFLESVSAIKNIFGIIDLNIIIERVFNDLKPDGLIKSIK